MSVKKRKPPVERAQRAVSAAANDLAPVLTAVMLAAPVVVAGLFYVWTRVVTVRLGYQISEASEVHHRLLEENRGLRIESAALKAPARLEKLARERYGLAAPRPEQIIRLDRVTQAAPGRASPALAQGEEPR